MREPISRRRMLKLTAGTAVGLTMPGAAFFACSDNVGMTDQFVVEQA